MNTFQERLLQLDRDLLSGNNICSSRGVLNAFPSSLKKLFLMRGLGLIICRQGNFQFAVNPDMIVCIVTDQWICPNRLSVSQW